MIKLTAGQFAWLPALNETPDYMGGGEFFIIGVGTVLMQGNQQSVRQVTCGLGMKTVVAVHRSFAYFTSSLFYFGSVGL